MNRSCAVAVTSLALVVALSPGVANAGQHPTLKGDKPPAAGHWKMKVGPSPSSKTASGSFLITKKHIVKRVQITVSHDGVADCGAGKFTVIGTKKLHKIYNGSGENEWVIGKYVAGQSPSYDAIKTSVKGHGHTYSARIAMSFNSRSDTDGPTYGYVAVKGTPGGICYLDFTFKKG